MDLCFKLNYSFIWKRHSRKGGKIEKNLHPLAHTCPLSHTDAQTHYLDRDLCDFKPSHTPSTACQAEQTGEPGCVKEACISLRCTKGLFLSFALSGGLSTCVRVSTHHWHKPTQLWLRKAPLTTQQENWISSDGYQTYSKSWQLFVDKGLNPLFNSTDNTSGGSYQAGGGYCRHGYSTDLKTSDSFITEQ